MKWKFWEREKAPTWHDKAADYDFDIEEVDGLRFYVFKTPGAAPYRRVLAYFSALDEVRLGATRKELDNFFDLQEQALNAGNIVKASSLLGITKAYTGLYASEQTIFNLGNAFILIEGEPLETFSLSYSERKRDLVANNELVRAFFLPRTWNEVSNSSESGNTIDILEYLASPVVKRAQKTFSLLTRSPAGKDSSPNQTKG